MFKKLYKAFEEHQQRRADFFIINSLSDRQLKDMGTTRGELKQRFYEKH
ncbi:DUF1127 domain-containing protein [bacterium]|nr:DUF1127 domain-containing protein [bacterium]